MTSSVFHSIKFTLEQAIATSALTCVLAFFAALGLSHFNLKLRWQASFNVLIIAPNILPSIFIIIGYLNAFQYFGGFPYGLWGVVLVQAMVNVGWVAINFQSTIEQKLGGVLDLCWIEGASRWRVLKEVVSFLRADIANQFLSVFLIAIASFSIPLILSGGHGSSIEVYIYEILRVKGDLARAALLALMQGLVVFFISQIIYRNSKIIPENLNSRHANLSPFGFSLVGWALLIPTFLLIVGLSCIRFNQDARTDLYFYLGDILRSLPFTFMIGLLSASVSFFILSLLIYHLPNAQVRRHFSSLPVTSLALLGFVFFMVGGHSPMWSMIKISLGLSLIFLPQLMRMFLTSELSRLENQYLLAVTLGASRGQIFKFILWPQLSKRVVAAAQLMALWSIGDFAFSSIVAVDSFHLSLVIRDLLTCYRLEVATLCCWLLVAVGIILYFLIGRIFNVSYK